MAEGTQRSRTPVGLVALIVAFALSVVCSVGVGIAMVVGTAEPTPAPIDAGAVAPVEATPDARPADAGPPDAGPADAGPPDGGPDAGPPDAGAAPDEPPTERPTGRGRRYWWSSRRGR